MKLTSLARVSRLCGREGWGDKSSERVAHCPPIRVSRLRGSIEGCRPPRGACYDRQWRRFSARALPTRARIEQPGAPSS